MATPTNHSFSGVALVNYYILFAAQIPALTLMRLVGITTPVDTLSELLALFRKDRRIFSKLGEAYHRSEVNSSRRRRRPLAYLAATLLLLFLRSYEFLASPLYCWSLLATAVFCGRHPIDAAVATLHLRCRLGYKRWSYYANHVSLALASALHATLVFLTWQFLDFATDLYPITGYGAWVSGAWLARCGLILVNGVVKARLKASEVCDRFEERILRAGFQIYIYKLLLCVPDVTNIKLVPWKENSATDDDVCCKVVDHIRRFSRYKVTTEDVWLIVSCLVGFNPSNMAGIDIGDCIRRDRGIALDDCMHVDKRWLKEKLGLGDEDARVVYGELCALVNSPDDVSLSTFTMWLDEVPMENELGRALLEEEETIIVSDRVVLALLMNQAFLMWLFLTGKSSTQLLVVIPFLYFAKFLIDELSIPPFRSLWA